MVESESSVVFKAPRRQWAVLTAPLLIIGSGAVPVLLGARLDFRWWGCGVAVGVLVLVVVALARNRTVLTKQGVTCAQVGRPWRPGRVTVAWDDVQAVRAARFWGATFPALYLADGDVIVARLPAGKTSSRFADEIALMQRWHVEAGGADVAAGGVGGPSRVRQAIVLGVCGVVVVLGVVGSVAGVMKGIAREPAVAVCPLVPGDLVNGLVAAPVSDALCRWKAGGDEKETLSVTVVPGSVRFAEESFEKERRRSLAKHVIRDLPGAAGYIWVEFVSGAAKVTARGVDGGYTVEVEARGNGQAAAERRADRVLEAVLAGLRGRE